MDYFFERMAADLHAATAAGDKNRMGAAIVLRGGSHSDRSHRAVLEFNRSNIRILDLFNARTIVFANCHDAFRGAAEELHHIERMNALAQEHSPRTGAILPPLFAEVGSVSIFVHVNVAQQDLADLSRRQKTEEEPGGGAKAGLKDGNDILLVVSAL